MCLFRHLLLQPGGARKHDSGGDYCHHHHYHSGVQEEEEEEASGGTRVLVEFKVVSDLGNLMQVDGIVGCECRI